MARADAYASAPDVRARLSFVATFTATSRPNATQVHEALLAASNEIDASLAVADYSTPVATGATVAREILRTVAADGAACRVVRTFPQGADGKHFDFYCTDFARMLEALRAGDAVLPDADVSATLGLAAHGAAATGASPFFTRIGVLDR